MVKILTNLILLSLLICTVLGQTPMTEEQAKKLTDEEKGKVTTDIPFSPSELVTIQKYLKWDEKHNKMKREIVKQ